MTKKILMAIALAITLALNASCIAGLTPSSSPVSYSQYQLEYMLLAKYPDYFWCDPDSYPVGRPPEQIQAEADDQFPTIAANTAEFAAILEHLGLAQKTDYSESEKLSIYQEHKKLTRALQIEPSGNIFSFTLSIGEGQGFRVKGTITPYGIIQEINRESSINTCPICLTRGTLIDTPGGPVPVEQIKEGMPVWTLNEAGRRVAATIVDAASTAVPPSFQVVKITLSDGRSVTTSPGHPSSTGRSLGEFQPGDTLDGARVTTVEKISYNGGFTYDILPSGSTGLYWANDILLRSTLFFPQAEENNP
jgi:hypothetical protein